MPVNVLKFVYYAFDPQNCFENSIRYDATSIPSTVSQAANAAECQAKCQSHASCNFWTLISGNTCYLKETIGTKITASSFTTSGPKECTWDAAACEASGPVACPWNVTAVSTGNVHDLLDR